VRLENTQLTERNNKAYSAYERNRKYAKLVTENTFVYRNITKWMRRVEKILGG